MVNSVCLYKASEIQTELFKYSSNQCNRLISKYVLPIIITIALGTLFVDF